MEKRKLVRAYHSQKGNAKIRGIEWNFTFDSWVAWWGEDIDKRGSGRFDLSMQRIADAGPYSPENTVKGHPKKNRRTASAIKRNLKQEMAKISHQKHLDWLMTQPSKIVEPDINDDEPCFFEFHSKYSNKKYQKHLIISEN
ncbi:MAG: hypothetical protein ACYC4K_03895 [Thiobacillus sp.]